MQKHIEEFKPPFTMEQLRELIARCRELAVLEERGELPPCHVAEEVPA